MKNPPFFIIGLPRSRTAWLANFLTWGTCFCWHEATRYVGATCALPDYLESTGAETIGNSDSGLVLVGPQRMQIMFPDARYVFVGRPWIDAADSYKKQFPEFNNKGVDNVFLRQAQILADWEAMMPIERKMSVRFNQLDNFEVLAAIWDFCTLELPFDYSRTHMLMQMRVDTVFSKMEKAMHPVYREKLNNIRSFQSFLP